MSHRVSQHISTSRQTPTHDVQQQTTQNSTEQPSTHLYAGHTHARDEVSPGQDLPSLREVQQEDDYGDDEQEDEDGDLEGGQVFSLVLQGVSEGLGPRRPRQG